MLPDDRKPPATTQVSSTYPSVLSLPQDHTASCLTTWTLWCFKRRRAGGYWEDDRRANVPFPSHPRKAPCPQRDSPPATATPVTWLGSRSLFGCLHCKLNLPVSDPSCLEGRHSAQPTLESIIYSFLCQGCPFPPIYLFDHLFITVDIFIFYFGSQPDATLFIMWLHL